MPSEFNSAFFPPTGSTYLQNQNGLNAYLPATSQFGFMSFWWTAQSAPSSSSPCDLFTMWTTTSKAINISIQLTYNSLQVTLSGKDGSNVAQTAKWQSTLAPSYNDFRWHLVQLYWDLTQIPNQLIGFFDGNPVTFSLFGGGQHTYSVAYQGQTFQIGHQTATTNTQYFGKLGTNSAGLAEFWFDPLVTSRNLSGSVLIKKVALPPPGSNPVAWKILTKRGAADTTNSSWIIEPGFIGEDGSGVTGTVPAIYLHGDPANFPLNNGGTGRSFTTVGTALGVGAANRDDPWFQPIFRWVGINLSPNYDPNNQSVATLAVRGSLFDGNNYYTQISTHIPGPVSSNKGMVSFWYKLPSLPANPYGNILQGIDYNGAHNDYLDIGFGSRDGVNMNPMLSLNGPAADGTTSLYALFGTNVVCDGKWHNVMMAWDVSGTTPRVVGYHDNVAMTLPALNDGSGNYNWGASVIVFQGLMGSADSDPVYSGPTESAALDTTPALNWFIPKIGFPAFPPPANWNVQNYNSPWSSCTGFTQTTVNGSYASAAGGSVTVSSAGSVTVGLTALIEPRFTCNINYYNNGSSSITSTGTAYTWSQGSGTNTGGVLYVNWVDVALQDGSGTKYGTTRVDFNASVCLPQQVTLTATVPVSAGSVTLTPVYRYSLTVSAPEGYPSPGAPNGTQTEETVTGVIKIHSQYSIDQQYYQSGVTVTAFEAQPFVFNFANTTNVDLANQYAGNLAELYYNQNNYDFVSALGNATTRGKFVTTQGTTLVAKQVRTMGDGPFGWNNRPNIYLSGPPDEFLNNRVALNATLNQNPLVFDATTHTSIFDVAPGCSDTIYPSSSDTDPVGTV